MNPSFGRGTVYNRAKRLVLNAFKRSFRRIRKVRLPRPGLGNIWLRLSYFEERLIKLDEDRQELFIENFYHSARQINYVTLAVVLVVILTYAATFQFRLMGFWEGLLVEGVLAFTLFYIVWYYRMGMEDLLDYLERMEALPGYAFRPRFPRKPEEKPSKPPGKRGRTRRR